MDRRSRRVRVWLGRLLCIAGVLATVVAGTVVVAGPAYAVAAKCTSGVKGPKDLDQHVVAIYGGTTFAKGSYCEVGNSRLYMQSDGNLVLYRIDYGQPVPIWAANTVNRGARALFQNDGNFVVYNSSNTPVWASNTCCASSILGILSGRRIQIRRAASAAVVWTRP